MYTVATTYPQLVHIFGAQLLTSLAVYCWYVDLFIAEVFMLRSTLFIGCLLLGTAVQATTVYKSIDAAGQVSYSDTPPLQRRYETVDISAPPRSSAPAEVQARQERMRTVTDAIATARKAREQARHASPAKTRSVLPANHRSAPTVSGYPYYIGSGRWQRPPPPSNRPIDQVDPPPVRRRLPTVPVIPR